MKLPLSFKGGRMDFDQLTSRKTLVKKGKTFIGADTEAAQVGELETIAAVTYELPLNGRYDITAGIHDAPSTVKQTSLFFMDGGTVYPTGDAQVVRCKNKYLKNDIYVAPLTGLEPWNIKKDVVIRIKKNGVWIEVVGTYEGYR